MIGYCTLRTLLLTELMIRATKGKPLSLQPLENVNSRKIAVVFFGGPSVIYDSVDLSVFKGDEFVVFAEARSITSLAVEMGLVPDFVYAPFPEKLQSNSLYQCFIHAEAVSLNLRELLSSNLMTLSHYELFKDLKNENLNFIDTKLAHKRVKMVPGKFFPESPYEVLAQFDSNLYSIIITPDQWRADEHRNWFKDSEKVLLSPDCRYSLKGKTTTQQLPERAGMVNSATMGLYDLIELMGFEKTLIVGGDMSMLGQMEFGLNHHFSDISAYKRFNLAARAAFSYQFPLGFRRGSIRFLKSIGLSLFNASNKYQRLREDIQRYYVDTLGLIGPCMRTKSELVDLEDQLLNNPMKFYVLDSNFKYFCRSIKGCKYIKSVQELF